MGSVDGFVSKIYLDDCFVTKTEEEKLVFEVARIKPNPSSSLVFVVLNENGASPVSFRVFDSSGKDVTELISYLIDPSQVTINVERLQAGVYFIQMQSEDRILTGRVIKI